MTAPAVLVLAYNRPHILRRTLPALLHGGPRIVYVSIDGPRREVAGDAELVSAVARIVEEMPWPCPVVIRRSEENRGLAQGVVEAITWFLAEQGEGVVLEDDVCIAPSSLTLAGLLLDAYRDDHTVGSISLFNPVPERRLRDHSFTAWRSRIPSSQYWGTWQDRWAALAPNLNRWRERLSPRSIAEIGGREFAEFLPSAWDQEVAEGGPKWEGRWMATHWFSGWSTITTTHNFSIHLGFSADATNSTEQPSWYPTKAKAWDGALILPPTLQVDERADHWRINQRYGLSLVKRVKRRVGRTFPSLRRAWRRVTVRGIK